MRGAARPRLRPSRLAWLTAFVVLAPLLAGCLPAPATREAHAIADLYRTFLLVAAGVAVVVLGLTIVMLVRYRQRPGQAELPPQHHGDLRFEAIWTGIPIAIVVGLFVLTLGALGRVDAVVERGSPAVRVGVEAFRWGWRFGYPDQGIVVEGLGIPGPELVVPVGEPVELTMHGVDVNHAFYVPRFLFKRDAIAGRDTIFGFQVDEPGTYRGQCAEFCGVGHSRMPFTVRAVDRAEYDAWLATAPRPVGNVAP